MGGKHLFLQGGNPPFEAQFGAKFAELSLKDRGKVAILLVEREGWKNYLPQYTDVLKENGIKDFFCLLLTPQPSKEDIEELQTCTGIIIGGGDTERYRDYIAGTVLGAVIKERYGQGVPVAGFSAGALISPEVCVIPPIDNARNEHLFLEGLGLLKDCVVSVHYTYWEEKENLKAAIAKTGAAAGYGIDDEAGMYFEDEQLASIEGGDVYTFQQKNGHWIEEKRNGQ
ncbi:Type 1 glutamine amidotransferase-like domain-containing protein [Planomicrobium sp. CPCC 101110]|uniref:Type 1 glutamine amidotransferase-like domain-containing protein n=1 Tax=Planomicrobium sp. CPCC 101110 TaxID=2599619 RepID=UPI0011B3A8C8|nr:Type 1 glutamine amidotransferase-like domain-containing protein [Planomicrobium sp. CPCC 101110]TWT25111.1 peptidase S51 dipeptidase E [Planomicrobium sp. CPCC 101110]